MRVLYVEDDPDCGCMVKYILGRLGHEVSVVGSGPEAMAINATNTFDVLLIDVGLPGGMDGIELRQNIPDVPAIAVTAYADGITQERCKKAQFQGFVAKPFVFDVIVAALKVIQDGQAVIAVPASPVLA